MPLTNDINRALHELPDIEKQMLVDDLLTQLDLPDPGNKGEIKGQTTH